ncbi:cytochrome P450 [Nocardia sp. NPDC005366]|uniref:cytochrome P450 n=1 Tax=Nocardia sp. NPDC005366 TaxID=3156878 RepID=UPI0033AF230A
MTEHHDRLPYDAVDISSLTFWASSQEERDLRFAELRRRDPVSWQRPVDSAIATPEIPGFWAVTTNELIREVSTHPELFCSGEGTQLEEIPDDFRTAAESFLGMDGEEHHADDLASMFVSMSFAGNDTTRTTISLGTKTFLDHPDQLAYLMADFDGRIDAAVEEVLRWVTPIMTFRRTATRDTVLGGKQIRAGDWVVMYYASGNRDDNAFDNPWTFDITRRPNGHVAFGGGGPRFCLGSFLAKMMLRHMFGELFHRVPALTLGTPDLLVGNFACAVKRLPVSTTCPVAR